MPPLVSWRESVLTKDQLIREYEARSGGLAGLLVFYAGLVVVLGVTASAII